MKEPEFVADRVFLHLSDIHFRKGQTNDAHDTNADLRNEIERDLRIAGTTRVRKVDGIIVSGDIAFGGQKEEFDFAKRWIERIRELLDCPTDGIMVTPGNHDVDRQEIPDGGDIAQIHDLVRSIGPLADRDEYLASVLRDNSKGSRIFSPIGAYNEFATQYGCAVTPTVPYWEKDFTLGNSGMLRIRGMTSTLISGPRDNQQTHKLVYGGAQRSLMRYDHLFRVVVGHHPPSWTLEGDDADRAFSSRAVIQLFGHKHESWFEKVGRGIRLIAGAVHPDRREINWDPRYSFIAVRLDPEGRLHIRVYPRRWTREETRFMGDFNSKGSDYREHVVEPS